MTNEEKVDEIMATIQYRLTPEIVRQSLLAAMQWKDASVSLEWHDVQRLWEIWHNLILTEQISDYSSDEALYTEVLRRFKEDCHLKS